jgi:hypothetical protein
MTRSDKSDSTGGRRNQIHNNMEDRQGTGSSTTGEKKKDNRSGNKAKTFYNRNDNGIEELKGNVFTIGTQGQQSSYLRTKKAIADYVGRTSDFGKELYVALIEGKEPEFKEPDEPPGSKPTQPQMKRYEILYKRHLDEQEKYKREKTKLFRLIIGQCSPTLRDKLESMSDYQDMEIKDDFVGLMARINGLVYSTDKTQYEYWRMQASYCKLGAMKQDEREPVAAYAKRFLAQVEATESLWGPLTPTTTKLQAADAAEDDQEEDQDEEERKKKQEAKREEEKMKARDKFLACLFLAGADRSRYKVVIDDLANEFTLGKVSYPEDVAGMLNLLVNRRGLGGGKAKQVEDLQDGVLTSFQQGQVRVRCNYCGKRGHASETCYDRIDDEERKMKEWRQKEGDDSRNSDSSGPGWFSTPPHTPVRKRYSNHQTNPWSEDDDDDEE